MKAWTRLVDWLRKRRTSQRLGEADAPADLGTARTRATGGSAEAPGQDRNSTTGATPSDTFVGRAGGDEAGDVGTSGGDARARQAPAPDEDDAHGQ